MEIYHYLYDKLPEAFLKGAKEKQADSTLMRESSYVSVFSLWLLIIKGPSQKCVCMLGRGRVWRRRLWGWVGVKMSDYISIFSQRADTNHFQIITVITWKNTKPSVLLCRLFLSLLLHPCKTLWIKNETLLTISRFYCWWIWVEHVLLLLHFQ